MNFEKKEGDHVDGVRSMYSTYNSESSQRNQPIETTHLFKDTFFRRQIIIYFSDTATCFWYIQYKSSCFQLSYPLKQSCDGLRRNGLEQTRTELCIVPLVGRLNGAGNWQNQSSACYMGRGEVIDESTFVFQPIRRSWCTVRVSVVRPSLYGEHVASPCCRCLNC